MTTADHNYTMTKIECLAIIWSIRKMRCYLALKWLNSIESPSGRKARWTFKLQQFQFDVRYRRGKLNVVADTLSRQPCEVLQGAVELEDHCEWIGKMKDKVYEEPEKFAEYMLENGQLYRSMVYRADDKDYFPWKLCVHTPHTDRVLYECHDSPTSGHLGSERRLPACHKDISGPACTEMQNTTFGTVSRARNLRPFRPKQQGKC